jgi:carbamoyl-phosphate synthase small subunit
MPDFARTAPSFSGLPAFTPQPVGANALLLLADGQCYWGEGFGAEQTGLGEVCFNTAMSGYQEIMTDPSYAGQLITFTFPHIGNVGCNLEDKEAKAPHCRGIILASPITAPANWRATTALSEWLQHHKLPAIAGIDTRALTRHIRTKGAPNGLIAYAKDGRFDIPALWASLQALPSLVGMDLAQTVTCPAPYLWPGEGTWHFPHGYTQPQNPEFNVVAIDYGAKYNILRCLTDVGCAVEVVPATTSIEAILARRPDGVFLSNGPGDPAATGRYALPVIRALLDLRIPIFGICLGHQLLALALGAQTQKMPTGHRGANHPVKDLATGQVEITSQNHGFVVAHENLPPRLKITHISLFDGSIEGIAASDAPAFSVQYHPEASPGPQDSHYLFTRFTELMASINKAR